MAIKYTVYVPTSKRQLPDVRDAISTLRLIVGGMSESEINGSWIDDNRQLIEEPITAVSFIMTPSEYVPAKNVAIQSNLNRLIASLKESGEQSVLVETAEITANFH